MLLELLRATLELGLPVAGLSWVLFYRLYSRGELARDADHKTIDANLKEFRKAEKQSKQPSDSVLHAKWMKFGGGFYGAAAAWTLIVIEASGIVGVIANPSSLKAMFRNGPIDFVVKQFVSQISSFVDAAVWFSWWPGKGHSPVVWVAIAYAGYIAGLNIAATKPVSAVGSWFWTRVRDGVRCFRSEMMQAEAGTKATSGARGLSTTVSTSSRNKACAPRNGSRVFAQPRL